MYCPKCGRDISKDSVFCKHCGEKVQEQSGSLYQGQYNQDYNQEYNQQEPLTTYPTQQGGGPYQTDYHQQQTTSNMAIASFVLSIVGLFCCMFIAPVIAIVLGFIAKNEIRDSGGLKGGEGFATAGIIIGFVGIIIDFFLIAI